MNRSEMALTFLGWASFLGVVIFIAIADPASQYEPSIYGAFPMIFWILVCAVYLSGILILFRCAYSSPNSISFAMGIALVIACCIVVLTLPFFRGYEEYPKGDALTHLGLVRDVLASGSFESNNLYPMVHLLGATISLAGGISLSSTGIVMYTVSTVVFLSNTYLLSIAVTDDRRKSVLILAAACPLYFSFLHTLIHPSMISLFMVPLLLYAYHKRHELSPIHSRASVLFILVATFVTLAHPVTALFTVVVILSINVSERVYCRFLARSGCAENSMMGRTRRRSDTTALMIIISTFFAWYITFSIVLKSFMTTYEFLVHGSGVSLYEYTTGFLSTADMPSWQAAQVFFFRYGTIFTYLIASLFSIYLLATLMFRKPVIAFTREFGYCCAYIASIGVSAFSLFAFTGEYDVTRISRFFLMLSPVVVGLTVGRISPPRQDDRSVAVRRRPRATEILKAIVLLLAVLSVFAVYGSPGAMQLNWQTTSSEVAGSQWFYETYCESVIISSTNTGLDRLLDYSFGTVRVDVPPLLLDSSAIPPHFGYNSNATLVDTYGPESHYLVISEADRASMEILPQNLWANAYVYTAEDFARLYSDSTVILLYSNGGFEIWMIPGV